MRRDQPFDRDAVGATVFVERADAKINLTLRVLGRRPSDGYHLLDSLVAFADVGDELSLDLNRNAGIEVTGAFGRAIDGINLVDLALQRARAAEPRLRLGLIRLTKNLPVAAGIGGGSADAAACLRLLRRANPEFADRVPWSAIAEGLGADVPVCLAQTTARIRGIGERVSPVAGLPPLPAVLVNAGGPVPAAKSAAVFKMLAARFLPAGDDGLDPTPIAVERAEASAGLDSASADAFLDWLARDKNDLDGPARGLMPEIGRVQGALAACQGVRVVRLSGAGPTCFGLFSSRRAAEAAALDLAALQPTWWVRATMIG